MYANILYALIQVGIQECLPILVRKKHTLSIRYISICRIGFVWPLKCSNILPLYHEQFAVMTLNLRRIKIFYDRKETLA